VDERETPVFLPSKKKTVVDFLPSGLILTLARPYLAGRTTQQALAIARRVYSQDRFTGTIDVLGEDAHCDEECEKYILAYKSLIDDICANPLPVSEPRQQLTVSFKPSMFSTMVPRSGAESRGALDKAFERIMQVVDYAAQHKVGITLEAEDHRWTNFHLEAYFALVEAGYTNIGTVLQTRLFRTETDMQRFDSRMRVRLVIGIYNEPAQMAHTDKRIMKQLLVNYSRELLTKGVYVEIASHDTKCIEDFYLRVVIPHRISGYNFEHQFLQGVPRRKLETSLVDGTYFAELKKKVTPGHLQFVEQLEQQPALVRMYYPFGTAEVSGAYCRRRLIENPNMIVFGIKNLFGIQ
jgi:proline dehydrogenase